MEVQSLAGADKDQLLLPPTPIWSTARLGGASHESSSRIPVCPQQSNRQSYRQSYRQPGSSGPETAPQTQHSLMTGSPAVDRSTALTEAPKASLHNLRQAETRRLWEECANPTNQSHASHMLRKQANVSKTASQKWLLATPPALTQLQ